MVAMGGGSQFWKWAQDGDRDDGDDYLVKKAQSPCDDGALKRLPREGEDQL